MSDISPHDISADNHKKTKKKGECMHILSFRLAHYIALIRWPRHRQQKRDNQRDKISEEKMFEHQN